MSHAAGKHRGRSTGKRATRATKLTRDEIAVRFVCAHAGTPERTLQRMLAEEFGIGKRQALRYLCLARARLATALGDGLADLSAALPSEIRALLDSCKAGERPDRRTWCRTLALIGDLHRQAQAQSGGQETAPELPPVFRIEAVDANDDDSDTTETPAASA